MEVLQIRQLGIGMILRVHRPKKIAQKVSVELILHRENAAVKIEVQVRDPMGGKIAEQYPDPADLPLL